MSPPNPNSLFELLLGLLAYTGCVIWLKRNPRSRPPTGLLLALLFSSPWLGCACSNSGNDDDDTTSTNDDDDTMDDDDDTSQTCDELFEAGVAALGSMQDHSCSTDIDCAKLHFGNCFSANVSLNGDVQAAEKLIMELEARMERGECQREYRRFFDSGCEGELPPDCPTCEPQSGRCVGVALLDSCEDTSQYSAMNCEEFAQAGIAAINARRSPCSGDEECSAVFNTGQYRMSNGEYYSVCVHQPLRTDAPYEAVVDWMDSMIYRVIRQQCLEEVKAALPCYPDPDSASRHCKPFCNLETSQCSLPPPEECP